MAPRRKTGKSSRSYPKRRRPDGRRFGRSRFPDSRSGSTTWSSATRPLKNNRGNGLRLPWLLARAGHERLVEAVAELLVGQDAGLVFVPRVEPFRESLSHLFARELPVFVGVE